MIFFNHEPDYISKNINNFIQITIGSFSAYFVSYFYIHPLFVKHVLTFDFKMVTYDFDYTF